jgi:hypothetical protein
VYAVSIELRSARIPCLSRKWRGISCFFGMDFDPKGKKVLEIALFSAKTLRN